MLMQSNMLHLIQPTHRFNFQVSKVLSVFQSCQSHLEQVRFISTASYPSVHPMYWTCHALANRPSANNFRTEAWGIIQSIEY
jgi:hypothetical protein